MNTTISIIVAVIYMIASLTAITLLSITVSRQKCLIKNLRRRIKVKRRRLVYWRDEAEKAEFRQKVEKRQREQRRKRKIRRYWQDRAIQAEEELKKLKEEKQVQ